MQSGIDAVKGTDVFVVATANDIRELPYSLRRAGRFDRILEIYPPNRREATEIVRHYLSDKKVAADVTAESVARLMDGNSCAALESVLNEAGIYAGFENKSEIGREHIVRAVLRDIFDADESVNEMSAVAKEEVAYHEAGHAVAALAFDSESVGLISVRPSKSDARGVVQIFKSENYFGSYARMRERVIALLAGKASVELKYGRLDVGAGSDIDHASAIVQRFITDYAASGFALFHPDNHYNLTSELHDDKIITERGAMLTRCYEEPKRFSERIGRLSKNLRQHSWSVTHLYLKKLQNFARIQQHDLSAAHIFCAPPFGKFCISIVFARNRCYNYSIENYGLRY